MPKPQGFGSELGVSPIRGSYRYTLAPWVWDVSNPSKPFWRMPASVGAVDLRSLPQQSLAGGAPQGFGFCASLSPVTGNSIATVPNMTEAVTTTAMQDAWEASTGFRPAGAKLSDLLWDQLTTGSDPSGADGPKPLLPGPDMVLKLFVGGHSLVKAERMRWGAHPHTGKVRDALRLDFEASFEETQALFAEDRDLGLAAFSGCQRLLDLWCVKHGAADWREFVPRRLWPHVPGRLPHRTTVTDAFTRADNADLGAAWNTQTGCQAWKIVSNHAEPSAITGANAAEHNTGATWGNDQKSQAVVIGIGSGMGGAAGVGTMVRAGAAAETFYGGWTSNTTGAADKHWLYKAVAGSYTQLAASTTGDLTVNDLLYTDAQGSTVKYKQNGNERISLTDTAITSGRPGIILSTDASTAPQLDDWEGADFGGAVTENANPVTSAASVVVPALSLSQALTPIAEAASVAAPAPSLSSPQSPATETAGIVAPAPALEQAGSVNAAAGSVVAPDLSSTNAPAVVASAGTVAAPAASLANTQGTVSFSGSLGSPDFTSSAAPSPVVGTFAVPAVTTGGDIVENPSPVVVSASVPAVTLALAHEPPIVFQVATSSVVDPALVLENAPPAVVASGTAATPQPALGVGVGPAEATSFVTAGTPGVSPAPSPVQVTGAFAAIATGLGIAVSAVTGTFSVPVVVAAAGAASPPGGRAVVEIWVGGAQALEAFCPSGMSVEIFLPGTQTLETL